MAYSTKARCGLKTSTQPNSQPLTGRNEQNKTNTKKLVLV